MRIEWTPCGLTLREIHEIPSAILNDVIWSQNGIIDNQRNFEENISKFTVCTEPGGGLAPLCVKVSAGTVVAKLGHNWAGTGMVKRYVYEPM